MNVFQSERVVRETDVIKTINQFAQDRDLCTKFIQEEDSEFNTNDQEMVRSFQQQQHQWKQLESFPGYFICNHGTIVSVRRRRLQQLKPYANKKAKTVIVSLGKTSKNLKKLVLETFDPHFKEFGGQIVFDLERWDNPSLQHLNYVSFSKASTNDADSSLKMGDESNS
jgi:hypothetical protein